MKRKITLLLLATSSVFAIKSQNLQENFNAPITLPGWFLVNNSDPVSTPGQNWFAGNGTVFPAYNGNPNDYVAANWASTSNTVSGQTISNWLITPTVNLANGGVLQFATRTLTNPASFADRLVVYMSTAGSGTNVGTTSTSLGTFSVQLVNINPNLTNTGYPDTWTVYTTTLSGLGAPTAGRFGFRYFVTNGGWGGANSDFIGLDAVSYSVSCVATVQSHTICTGTSATLVASGTAPGTSYTWNPGSANTSSIVVNPGSTTTYTLEYDESGNLCPALTSTVTVSSQLNITISASSESVCPGETVTLTAQSSASSYSWSTGDMTPVITVTPNSTTTYSVGGVSGSFPNLCIGGNTIMITTIPAPTLNIALNPAQVCQGKSYTLNASGADSYVWHTSGTASTTTNPLVLTAGTTGAMSYTLEGTTIAGCDAATTVEFTVAPTPTITISSSTNIACTNSTVSITGSGASSYIWSGSSTSTNNAIVFTTGATAGTNNFTLTGTNSEGCSSSAAYTQSVVLCSVIDGITENAGYAETNIFPNPFSTEILISGFDGAVLVYNAIGQVVSSGKISVNGTINTEKLPAGAYMVKAYSASGELVKSVKLMKN